MLTSFVFDITRLKIFDVKVVSMLHFLMFPYSILTPSIQFNTQVYSSFVRYLYQSGYYSYLIKVGLGLGEESKASFALFNLSLLGCQSLWETILQKNVQAVMLTTKIKQALNPTIRQSDQNKSWLVDSFLPFLTGRQSYKIIMFWNRSLSVISIRIIMNLHDLN